MAWYDSAGNASDIVSAVCNMTTLAVTVYIAYKAKDFLSSKIRDEGFKRGAEILDEIDKLYDSIQPIRERYVLLCRDYNIAFSDKNYLNLSPDSVLERYGNLLDEVRMLKGSINNIHILLNRLKRWGLSIKHETFLKEVIFTAKKFLHSIHALTEHLLSGHWFHVQEYAETSYEESLEAEKNYDLEHAEFELIYKKLLDYKLEDLFET